MTVTYIFYRVRIKHSYIWSTCIFQFLPKIRFSALYVFRLVKFFSSPVKTNSPRRLLIRQVLHWRYLNQARLGNRSNLAPEAEPTPWKIPNSSNYLADWIIFTETERGKSSFEGFRVLLLMLGVCCAVPQGPVWWPATQQKQIAIYECKDCWRTRKRKPRFVCVLSPLYDIIYCLLTQECNGRGEKSVTNAELLPVTCFLSIEGWFQPFPISKGGAF